MMRLKGQVANLFTLMNLVCGVVGILVISRNLHAACLLIFVGAFFDFSDGLVARALKTSSEIGKQLDSLADMVTFGVLPGIIAHAILSNTLNEGAGISEYLPVLIPAFSAIRLAKFNIDTKQSRNFIGMPTPANAILWASLGISGVALSENIPISNNVFIIILIISTSLLLVLPVSLFSFKLDKFSWKGNEMKFLLILSAIPLFCFFNIAAIPVIIILYILFSIIHFNILNRHEVQS